MPDMRRTTCRRCEKLRSEVGTISWTGLCVECAKGAVASNVEGLMVKREPELSRWRRGVAASVGAIIPDDSPHSI